MALAGGSSHTLQAREPLNGTTGRQGGREEVKAVLE